MSETPQEIVTRWLDGTGGDTKFREAIRAVLAENESLRTIKREAVLAFDQAATELEQAEAERDTLRESEVLHQQEGNALRAEVSRLCDIISPGDAAAYEEGMAALQRRADVANVALLDAVKVRRQLRVAEAALRGILEYEPVEVCKDDFAYDRMVESYRDFARASLRGTSPEEKP